MSFESIVENILTGNIHKNRDNLTNELRNLSHEEVQRVWFALAQAGEIGRDLDLEKFIETVKSLEDSYRGLPGHELLFNRNYSAQRILPPFIWLC